MRSLLRLPRLIPTQQHASAAADAIPLATKVFSARAGPYDPHNHHNRIRSTDGPTVTELTAATKNNYFRFTPCQGARTQVPSAGQRPAGPGALRWVPWAADRPGDEQPRRYLGGPTGERRKTAGRARNRGFPGGVCDPAHDVEDTASRRAVALTGSCFGSGWAVSCTDSMADRLRMTTSKREPPRPCTELCTVTSVIPM